MDKRILFRGLDHSAQIERFANDQLARIEKFLEHEREPIYLGITFTSGRKHDHPRVELLIKSPHYDLVTHFEKNGVDMYDAITHVVDVMYQKLHEKKKELTEKLQGRGKHPEDDYESA